MMNENYANIYRLIALIPPGKVATYGQIARLSGIPRSPRAVVWAMRSTPADLKLPCHRVVNRSGTLAPYYVFGGQGEQRSILEEEEVIFRLDGKIDLTQSLWAGPSSLLGDKE